ncbi:MAG: prepilin-type N-terminal cleavage/methylation domain-containing protein [Thermodesulfovibrionales bacterium]|nr:prepilin-type N-terminal cleavage/methylation domain-containing protein [Thermodesulfovibrionales bacterium]
MPILETGTCNKKGFTLLELIVVIFILSISAAIIFPSFTLFEDKKIKSEAKKIASILRFLNDNAITTKESNSLKIDLGKKLFTYISQEGKKEEIFETLNSVELPSKGRISIGEVTIFFSQHGASENINIYLSDKNSNLTIALNHLSGRVKIYEQ